MNVARATAIIRAPPTISGLFLSVKTGFMAPLNPVRVNRVDGGGDPGRNAGPRV
jgi:hypothetical protein